MAKGSNRQERWGRTAQVTGWAAGIGITLVEMQFGMEYVFTHVAGHMNTIVSWLPMLSTLVRDLCR